MPLRCFGISTEPASSSTRSTAFLILSSPFFSSINTLSPSANLVFLNNSEGIVSCLLLVIVAIYDIVRRYYHSKEISSSVRRTMPRRNGLLFTQQIFKLLVG